MSRRLLGPVGGLIAFLTVAALVFAGLGWVTYAAIGVEHAQREAAARAELGNDLHRALWRLDGRMLSTLWGEDSRPYYDYSPPDPAATPLLGAELPAWMKLHFQLDPGGGWVSPQVLDDSAVVDHVRLAWGDWPVSNLNGERVALRNTLREKFPPPVACEVFARRDLATASDPLPFAAPFFAGEVNPSQPPVTAQPPAQTAASALNPTPKPPPTEPLSGGPVTPGDVHATPTLFFGVDLCWLAELRSANQLAENNLRNDLQKKLNEQSPSQAGTNPQWANNNTRGGRGGQKDQDAERGFNDYFTRAQTIGKGLQEAKGAAGYQMGRGPYPQNSIDLRNSSNYGPGMGNFIAPGSQGDKYSNPVPPTTPPSPTAGGGSPGGTLAVPGGTFPPGIPPSPGAGGFGQPGLESKEKDAKTRDEKSGAADGRALGSLAAVAAKNVRPGSEKEDVRKAGEALKNQPEGNGAKKTETGGITPPATPPTASLPVAVHLGSMRPQWITAPDGTQMLVLVRTAKFNDKTVYQGIVIDWAKLETELKSVVEDLFPDAALVAVKEPDGVTAERAMTTLPVQLDPGPRPEPPPAGWTPLRIGLVLAWVAAVVAFVAVGFSGWSLIDLAERRIRFVSAVTHELRTPLTSLRLYLDLLVSGMIRDETKRQEYLSTLAVESDRLHRLVDNVLDFAKLEKRKKNGDIKPIRVNDLTDQIRATWTDRAAQDGKELIVISTLPTECEVATDAAMILQIVGNLIDNARKYTRDASDRRIWVWAKPGDGNAVLLEVEDRGAGVPAGERKSIFKPFRRGECADSKAGGAGLGLALAKSWAEVLGAKLAYRPADGGIGACFRLELPRR